MSSNTLTTVVCTECRHENEPERVYCHGCGTRLDRSAVKVKKRNDVADARKRVKQLFDPQRAQIRALFFRGSKVLLGSFAAAILVLVFLPPPLPAPSKTVMLASQIRFDLEGATTRHQPPQLQYTDEQINAFLAYALKTKQAALNKPLLDFKRAVMTFHEGACNITAERSISGLYPVYLTWNFEAALVNGKLTTKTRGGSLGSLPIHPKVAQYMGILFSDISTALNSELKMLAKLKGMELHEKNVVLIAAQ